MVKLLDPPSILSYKLLVIQLGTHMARSMTAYGRAHVKTEAGAFLIEIHSVNRKNLDIQLNLPKDFLVFDIPIRQRLAECVKRGRLTVKITREDAQTVTAALPALETLKELHREWSHCAHYLGYDSSTAVPFSFLVDRAASVPDREVDTAVVFGQLNKGIEEALHHVLLMKEKEAHVLVTDMESRMNTIEAELHKIEGVAGESAKRYRDKLAQRLEDIHSLDKEDEERLARELVIFADKVDITEESIRLKSHVQQFRDLLGTSEARIGKELEFLTQEMNREANTMAAKSQELVLTRATLVIKSELEKIREQLQNIE